jgi:hypothetical protein
MSFSVFPFPRASAIFQDPAWMERVLAPIAVV